MVFNQVEATYICQLNKPENRKMLEEYKARKDGSKEELARYYKDVVNALRGTPAWGVSGVNKMINDLTEKVRATFIGAKRGKTSAFAHSGKMLRDIEYFGETEAKASYNGFHKLLPIITDEELERLAALA
jgi:hypothetical protein